MNRIAGLAVAAQLLAASLPLRVGAEEAKTVVTLPAAEAWGYCDGQAVSDSTLLFSPVEATPTVWLTCEPRGDSHQAETFLSLPRRGDGAGGESLSYFSAAFEERIAEDGSLLYGTSIKIDGATVAQTRQLELLDLAETVSFQLVHPLNHPFLKALANGRKLSLQVDGVQFVFDLAGAKQAVDTFVKECGAPTLSACFPENARARKREMDLTQGQGD